MTYPFGPYDHERAMARAEAHYLTPPDADHIKECPMHEDAPSPEDGEEPECRCQELIEEAKADAAEAKADRKREEDL